MAQQPEKVIRCGDCHRVVAQVEEGGQVVIYVKHDKEYHRTVLPVELSKRP